MICACIFDMDGTVANTLASIAGFGNRALEACGYPTLPVEEYRSLAGNGADILMRRMLTASLGRYQEEQVAPLRAVYDRLYAQDPMRLVTEYPGMGDTLRALKAGGIRLGVISNKPDDMTCQVAERLYPGLFQAVRGTASGNAPEARSGRRPPHCPTAGGCPGKLPVYRRHRRGHGDRLQRRHGDSGRPVGGSGTGKNWCAPGAQHVISQPQELLALAGL